MRLALAFALITAPAAADYSDHPYVSVFADRPCTAVLGAIDADTPDTLPLQSVVRLEARRSIVWGFLLGYDTARGGLAGEEETTLVRLRKECADAPDTPALQLLRGMDQAPGSSTTR